MLAPPTAFARRSWEQRAMIESVAGNAGDDVKLIVTFFSPPATMLM